MTERFAPQEDHPEFCENGPERLTCIRDAYTLASTPEQGSETDKLMINNFLTTLAEIALAVASRKITADDERGTIIP